MSKAKDFLKMDEAGKGGKGKKRSVTITCQQYDSKLCSGYCEHAKTEEQQLRRTFTSSDYVYYCSLFKERVGNIFHHPRRIPQCLKVFGE